MSFMVTTMSYKIVLDAGHCTGYNKSAVFPSYREGNMTWALYLKLRAALEKLGYTVIGTRGNQSKDTEVYDRGQIAKGSDLFISLHSNACGSESVRRVVVIPPYKDVNGTYKLAQDLAEAVSGAMGITDHYELFTRTYSDLQGRTRDYYGVIRGAVDAGGKRNIIIEHSFHTNLASAKWLYNDANLQKLADVEAKVIAAHLPLATKPATPEIVAKYKVGDPYLVKTTDVYSTGRPVAKFAVGQVMTIKQVLPGKILLAEINSWVKV